MVQDARVVVKHLDEDVAPEPAQPLAVGEHGDGVAGGLVNRLDGMMLRQSCPTLGRWVAEPVGCLGVAGSSFRARDLLAQRDCASRRADNTPLSASRAGTRAARPGSGPAPR